MTLPRPCLAFCTTNSPCREILHRGRVGGARVTKNQSSWCRPLCDGSPPITVPPKGTYRSPAPRAGFLLTAVGWPLAGHVLRLGSVKSVGRHRLLLVPHVARACAAEFRLSAGGAPDLRAAVSSPLGGGPRLRLRCAIWFRSARQSSVGQRAAPHEPTPGFCIFLSTLNDACLTQHTLRGCRCLLRKSDLLLTSLPQLARGPPQGACKGSYKERGE